MSLAWCQQGQKIQGQGLTSLLAASSSKRSRVLSVQLCTDCAVVKMQFFCAQKTNQESFQMLTILCHLARQSQCHTQSGTVIMWDSNTCFQQMFSFSVYMTNFCMEVFWPTGHTGYTILKTLSVLSTNRATEEPFKNLVHNGVDFCVQNALKLTYEHL